MSKKRKTTIRYLNKDHEHSTKDHTKVKWYKDRVENSNTKRFHITLTLLYRLSTLSRLLIDFICEEMDSENLIVNTSQFKNNFNEVFKNVKKKTIRTIA